MTIGAECFATVKPFRTNNKPSFRSHNAENDDGQPNDEGQNNDHGRAVVSAKAEAQATFALAAVALGSFRRCIKEGPRIALGLWKVALRHNRPGSKLGHGPGSPLVG